MSRQAIQFATLILLLAVTGAGRPTAAALQQEPGAMIMEGTLVNVDSKSKLIRIKVADGSEMEFAYTEQTEIAGTGETAEGLASRNGSRLRVHYQVLAGISVAVKIEVLPVQAQRRVQASLRFEL